MDRLAELRERRALTLRELSEMSGVAADTINQIELGHRKARPSTLRKLARALDVEVRELFEEPALPKAEAPDPGPHAKEPSIVDMVHDAALRQIQSERQAHARAKESESVQAANMNPANDAMHRLLERSLGEVAEAFIDYSIQKEREVAILRNQLQERERAHS